MGDAIETKNVIRLIGSLLLIGALVAILVFQGGAEDTERAYRVTWSSTQAAEATIDDELSEGEQDVTLFPVARANVTRIDVWLNWTDDVGDPDTFRLQVEPPNATPRTLESENGSIHLSFRPNPVPSPITVRADTEREARNRIAATASQNGSGQWLVLVNLTDAPGQRPVPQAPQLETEADGSNTYQLAFQVHVFEATVQPAGDAAPTG